VYIQTKKPTLTGWLSWQNNSLKLGSDEHTHRVFEQRFQRLEEG
jgi:hypothetical protein